MRKKILINKEFQLSILFYFSLLALIIMGIFYFANMYFFVQIKAEALKAGVENNDVFFSYINQQKLLMNKIFITTSIVSMFIIIIGGILISHRVAGPLYRLTKHLQNSRIGDVQPLSFRKNDYFKEIENAFNEFINRR